MTPKDNTLREEFEKVFYGETNPRRTALLIKDSNLGEIFQKFLFTKIHSARKEAQMELLERVEKSLKDKRVIMWSDDSAQHIRNIQNNETIEKCLDIIQSEEEAIKN